MRLHHPWNGAPGNTTAPTSQPTATPGQVISTCRKKILGFASNVVYEQLWSQANQLIIHNENADGVVKDLTSIATGLAAADV